MVGCLMLHGRSNNQLETFNIGLLDTEPGLNGLDGPPINLQGSGRHANEWWWKKHTQQQPFTRRIFYFSFHRSPIKAPLTGQPDDTTTRNSTNLQGFILFFGEVMVKIRFWSPLSQSAATRASMTALYATINPQMVLKLTVGPPWVPYRTLVPSVALLQKVVGSSYYWWFNGGLQGGLILWIRVSRQCLHDKSANGQLNSE